MFESTPDLAHREQMSEVVRYVEIDFEKKTVYIIESFLGFIQLSDKDAASLAQTILEQLEKDDMNVENCRSQCYDNAAVMAGHKSGVHQRITEKNNLAMLLWLLFLEPSMCFTLFFQDHLNDGKNLKMLCLLL